MFDLIAYKILLPGELVALERDGTFAGSALDIADGFIHMSVAAQVDATIDRHFAGVPDLCLAAVDIDAVRDDLRWEKAANGESYPHLYAPLSLETVLAYGPVERDDAGRVKLPVAG